MEVASIEPVECVVGSGQEIDRKEESFSLGDDQVEIPTHLQDLFERSKRNLDEIQQNLLKNLLVEFEDVFSKKKTVI